jgi:exodeoxyribonuclease V alpha subunit
MRDINNLFENLAKSKFRSHFRLKGREKAYLDAKGMETIMEHARHFIEQRLAPADIPNDGKQTPMRNHPVFIAQHATATCCRKCMEKWHGIPKGKTLDQEEIDYVAKVVRRWLNKQQ